jgi:hypothetical protein
MNSPSGVALAEEDLILIGVGLFVLSVAGWLIYRKVNQELDIVADALPSGSDAQSAVNNIFTGPANQGSDVMPGSPDDPENYQGYE